MIKIKFKKLIDERNISITNMHEKTGISRSTLTLLAGGESKGIQFDTLEKICLFLQCTPNDLIVITPNEFSVNFSLGSSKFEYEKSRENIFYSWLTFNDYTINNKKMNKASDDYFFLTIIDDEPVINNMLHITVKVPEDKNDYHDEYKQSKSYKETVDFFSNFDDEQLNNFAIRIAKKYMNELIYSNQNNIKEITIYLKLDPTKKAYYTIVLEKETL